MGYSDGEEMKIKNWAKFQHYKNRRPPWIRLHRTMLEQRDISMLADRSFRVLVNLWLLASEDDDMSGGLPDVDEMAFRLRMDKDNLISDLKELDAFFDSEDSDMLAECRQVAVPETETETETETEERQISASASVCAESNDGAMVVIKTEKQGCPHEDIVSAYHDLLPMMPRVRAWTPARKKALQARWSEDKARQDLSWWTGLFSGIAQSDFLTGRAGGFTASIEWIIKPANFLKILEGNYTNNKSTRGNNNGNNQQLNASERSDAKFQQENGITADSIERNAWGDESGPELNTIDSEAYALEDFR